MNKTNLGFVLLFSLFGLCSCSDIKYQNFYLPKDFIGNVAVIYKNDAPISKDTKNVIIPVSGILYSSTNFVAGDYITHYFQKNDSNYYDTLSVLVSGRTPDMNVNQIVFPRILTFEKYQKKPEYTIYTFYVGRKTANDLEKDRFHFERELEKLLLK